MNTRALIIFIPILLFALTACSDNTPAQKTAAEKEHFLSDKMETIKKAEQVEKMILDAADNQRRNIENNGG